MHFAFASLRLELSLQKMSLKSIQVRLFLTCWIVYALHFATDFVREHYLALTIVERHSFRVDEYLGLHSDIFEISGRGAYLSANPGASMIAAIPYFVFRPVIANIASRFKTPPSTGPAVYHNPIGARQRF